MHLLNIFVQLPHSMMLLPPCLGMMFCSVSLQLVASCKNDFLCLCASLLSLWRLQLIAVLWTEHLTSAGQFWTFSQRQWLHQMKTVSSDQLCGALWGFRTMEKSSLMNPKLSIQLTFLLLFLTAECSPPPPVLHLIVLQQRMSGSWLSAHLLLTSWLLCRLFVSRSSSAGLCCFVSGSEHSEDDQRTHGWSCHVSPWEVNARVWWISVGWSQSQYSGLIIYHIYLLCKCAHTRVRRDFQAVRECVQDF